MTFKRLAAAALFVLTAASAVHAADEQSVRDHLMKNTGLRAESVTPSPVPGIWEVFIQDRLFYVDDTVEHIFSGSIISTKSQTNLTQERLRRYARENWNKWPLEDAVKQVFGKGERQVIVFSDANCGYCRQMEPVYEAVGNLTVYTFIAPMIRGEQNNREIVCSKDRSKAWHDWMRNGVAPAPAPADCDASVLQRNLQLTGRYTITGAPTFFFPTGDRLTGAVSAEQFEGGAIFLNRGFVIGALAAAPGANVFGFEAARHQHPKRCVATLAARFATRLVAKAPEIVDTNKALDGRACILCDDRPHEVKRRARLVYFKHEGRTEQPVLRVDCDACERCERNALCAERAEFRVSRAFLKEDEARILRECIAHLRRILLGPRADVLHGELVSLKFAVFNKPIADCAVFVAVLIGKAYPHKAAVRQRNASRALNLQEESVNGIVHPSDGPAIHVGALLYGGTIVIGDDASPFEFAAKTQSFERRIEFGQVNDEEIVGHAVNRVDVRRRFRAATAKKRFVVAGGKPGFVA